MTATNNPTTVHGSATLSIANEFLIHIADGTGAGAHPIPPTVCLKFGAKIRILDSDSTGVHRIHGFSSGSSDFPEQTFDMTPGQEYALTMATAGARGFSVATTIPGTGLTNVAEYP